MRIQCNPKTKMIRGTEWFYDEVSARDAARRQGMAVVQDGRGNYHLVTPDLATQLSVRGFTLITY